MQPIVRSRVKATDRLRLAISQVQHRAVLSEGIRQRIIPRQHRQDGQRFRISVDKDVVALKRPIDIQLRLGLFFRFGFSVGVLFCIRILRLVCRSCQRTDGSEQQRAGDDEGSRHGIEMGSTGKRCRHRRA